MEGAEIGVLRSAEQLLHSRRVRRLVMEYAPERWPKFGVEIADGVRVVRTLFGNNSGYLCRCVHKPGHEGPIPQFDWPSQSDCARRGCLNRFETRF